MPAINVGNSFERVKKTDVSMTRHDKNAAMNPTLRALFTAETRGRRPTQCNSRGCDEKSGNKFNLREPDSQPIPDTMQLPDPRATKRASLQQKC